MKFTTTSLLLLLTPPNSLSFLPPTPSARPPTSLSNILRDFASYSSSPWDDPSLPSQSSDWRRSSGYSSKPPPLPLGGSVSPYGVRKEMETNPYYDAGWAQSVRRDDPNNTGRWGEGGSNYNGYNDPYDYTNRYYNNPSTYPGMSSPDRAQKFYTNPTNPYYDPLWSQGYADRRSPSNLREDGFYDGPYGAWGYEGMGGYGGAYGRGMGPGRRLYAVSTDSGERKKRGLNQNRLMGSAKTTSRQSNTALRMSYYDPEWDGPPFDPRMPPPLMPPYMRGPRGYRMPPGRPLSEIAEDANSNRYNAGNDNRFRRNPGGRGRIPNGPMGGGPMGYPGPFGRDDAPGRTSLKDMAMRSTTSFDKQIIQSMNTRPNARAGSPPVLPDTTEATSTSSQYVPLNAVAADRAPPLNVQPPVPRPDPYMEMRDMPSSEMPPTIHVSRNVRPSVVLVTSKGVGNANSQGSGFIVEFGEDDAALDVDKDTCHILTSAHVAPPGWKVSVTFPNDPDKEYSAEVVGRKLNSDLALLRVETNADDNEDYPFPPPLMLSSEDVFTSIGVENDRPPLAEIGSPVYAFGYPMGVEGPTMTSGILSATTKGINYMDAPTGEEGTEKSRPFEKTSFVITDAAMAGGMSGGPLVNYNGVVVGVNALVRPDLRALGNYAVSSVECEEFLEKLEDQNSGDSVRSSRKASVARPVVETDTEGRRNKRAPQEPVVGSNADDVAGFRVMLYGYSTSKDEAGKILRRLAGLDQNRAENALRSATSFGAGVVDEFYVSGSRGGPKAAQKSAESLKAKLESEGLMAVVEPLHILN